MIDHVVGRDTLEIADYSFTSSFVSIREESEYFVLESSDRRRRDSLTLLLLRAQTASVV
jgi:hypothetical protein